MLSKKAKKLVHWHDNYVVFVTPEAKALKWNDKTIVKISVVEEKAKRKSSSKRGWSFSFHFLDLSVVSASES